MAKPTLSVRGAEIRCTWMLGADGTWAKEIKSMRIVRIEITCKVIPEKVLKI